MNAAIAPSSRAAAGARRPSTTAARAGSMSTAVPGDVLFARLAELAAATKAKAGAATSPATSAAAVRPRHLPLRAEEAAADSSAVSSACDTLCIVSWDEEADDVWSIGSIGDRQ